MNFTQLIRMNSSQQFFLWALKCGYKSLSLSLSSRRHYQGQQITSRLWTELSCSCKKSTSFVYPRDSASCSQVHGQYWDQPCKKWPHRTFSTLLKFISIEFDCVCSTKFQSLCLLQHLLPLQTRAKILFQGYFHKVCWSYSICIRLCRLGNVFLLPHHREQVRLCVNLRLGTTQKGVALYPHRN